MYCHLCQEPRPESKSIKENKERSSVKRKEYKQEQSFERKPINVNNFRENNFTKSSVRKNDDSQFNNCDSNIKINKISNDFNNNLINGFLPNNNFIEMPLDAMSLNYAQSNSSAFNQNKTSFFQNTNSQMQQDFYEPNPINFNNADNFYNPNPNSFSPDKMFQNNPSNNNMNFMPPNNFPLNESNSNTQNFPFFINQNPNNWPLFHNNDNFNGFNVNQSFQSFPNFNDLGQSQMFDNNSFPVNFNNDKLYSEHYDFNNPNNEHISNVNLKKRNFNNEKNNYSGKENKFLNRKRDVDKLVEFEENASKRYSGTGAKNLEYIKIGDWICRKCDNINFSYRMKCHRCKYIFEEVGENINGNLILLISF